ncbi:hypothetical protein R1flu_027560 [Riccia fluitans]|uniref:DUF4283 domain-containing protein n=1 Tax=Riccia fluitans TaxID=41844 RepID=A0ABD1XJ66_9MARC
MSVRYHAPRPWPDDFSLVDTIQIDRSEFNTTEVIEQFGRVRIIPRAWTIRKLDWYLDILEFVCIRRLWRQKEKVFGPYNYISGTHDYVLLQDSNTLQFWFPKYLREEEEGRTFYTSTAIWIWSYGCYCKAIGGNTAYPPGCFCLELFNRGLCIQCSYNPRLHTRGGFEVIKDSQVELSPDNVEETLSQNICLCKEIFSIEKKCFCGYGTEKYQAVGKTIHEEEILRSEQSPERSRESNSKMDRNSEAKPKTVGTEPVRRRRPSRQDRNAKQNPIAAAKDWKQTNENNPQTKRMNARRHSSDDEVQQANQDLPKVRKSRRVPEKVFDVSLTIGVPGANIDTEIFYLLVSFLHQRAEMGVLALERGDAFLELHVQGMMRLKTSNTRSLKAKIKSWIGWDYHGLIGSEGSRKENNDDVKELPGKEHSDGPADEDAISMIPIVDLNRNIDSSANLDRVWDTLLYAGFGVGIYRSNNDVKQEKSMENLLDYFHLWD